MSSYMTVIRKLASLFRSLEEQGSFLSQEDLYDEEVVNEPRTTGKVYALCEIILEDLNNYCECMIPIGKEYQSFIPLMVQLAMDSVITDVWIRTIYT